MMTALNKGDLGKEKYIDDLFASIKNEDDFKAFGTLCRTNNNVTVELADAGWIKFVEDTKKQYLISVDRNLAKIEFDGVEFLIASNPRFSPQMTSS